jgi:predicted TIM-barrel enzyme
VDGSQISARTAGLVVHGAQTVFISEFEVVMTAAADSQATLTVGDSTITATAASRTGAAIVIDRTTLSPSGPAITIHSTELSARLSGIMIEGTRSLHSSQYRLLPMPYRLS